MGDLIDTASRPDSRIQEIRAAEKKLGRTRSTLANRQEALEDLEADYAMALNLHKDDIIEKLRRAIAKKKTAITESEGDVLYAESIIYADNWAPKKPLSNDAQLKIKRGW